MTRQYTDGEYCPLLPRHSMLMPDDRTMGQGGEGIGLGTLVPTQAKVAHG